jgi:hypothetical protein
MILRTILSSLECLYVGSGLLIGQTRMNTLAYDVVLIRSQAGITVILGVTQGSRKRLLSANLVD